MPTFLQDVVDQIEKQHPIWADLIFILPSKRAGNFLKSEIRSRYNNTGFAPKIWSIEEFVQKIADLKLADSTTLSFIAYEAYQSLDLIKNKDSFEQFNGWAPALLGDLNEMDRYCLDTATFFSNLSGIKAIERWSMTEESTEFVNNYLAFWRSIPDLYLHLTQELLTRGIGYQGLIYRKASEDIEHYIDAHRGSKHVFLGFNALNAAEQIIIQELLQNSMAEVYWDMDQHFLDKKQHVVTNFVQSYFKEWKYYHEHSPKIIHRHFEEEKSFRLVQSESNLAQVYYTTQLLSQLTEEEIRSTAVVLADENLLMPLLQAIPQNIKQVNVTMGAPLSIFPITDLFRLLLLIQQQGGSSIYHRHLDALLNHPVITYFLEQPQELNQEIKSQNWAYIKLTDLLELTQGNDHTVLSQMLKPWENSRAGIDKCLELLEHLRLQRPKDLVLRTSAFTLYQLFLELKAVEKDYQYVDQIGSLHKLYLESCRSKQLDFESDAFQGLQIMGLLETRCLDFDRIILLSVNEGILPAGKSQNSFLTYDLKKEFDLPTQQDKDAIYAYHFYRMLFRAKQVDLLYVDQRQGLGGTEKSRFIRELELTPLTGHHFEQLTISSPISIEPEQLKKIDKTDSLNQRLQAIAIKGFSPSSLTNYIRNPIDFYTQRVLGIREVEEVEETVAYNTLGNVVHNSLENLYKPWEGQLLSTEALNLIKTKAEEEVKRQFELCFKQGDLSGGKNLIISRVALRYVEQLIETDLSYLSKGKQIEIISLEKELSMELNLPGSDLVVRLYGKADRIDRVNEELRIVDYKTGTVEPADLKLKSWDLLKVDYKYAKAFQVLCYALMLYDMHGILASSSGIISFKRMGNGYMPFKDVDGSTEINDPILSEFENVLIQLISEIMNPEIQLTEKTIK